MSDTNFSIYDERLTAAHPSERFSFVPDCIYFFYMLFDGERLRVDHFFYNQGPLGSPGEWNPIAPGEVDALLPQLVANARSNGVYPKISGADFQQVVCTYKSHMAFVVDAPGWALRKRADGKGAIAFNVDKGSTPNHSFFDARDIAVTIPRSHGGQDIRSAVTLINHLKRNADGDDLIDETQKFTFDIYVAVPYRAESAASLLVVLDPDIENKGGSG